MLPIDECLSGKKKLDGKRISTHRPVGIPSRFNEVEERRKNNNWNKSKEEREEGE